ncbi:MAG: caspase family protein [Acidobacteria bacterium]|nr:caspase family protein [Acidobacteriota bacterium]
MLKSAILAASLLLGMMCSPQSASAQPSARAKRITPEQAESVEKHLKIAVLVGIGDYERSVSGLNKLNYPTADVVELGKQLQLQDYDVRLLLDRQATSANIRDAFRELTEAVEPNQGSFLFFFSGHGFRTGEENYLATYGTTVESIAQQGLPLSEIQKMLAATGARQRMAFIDACRNDPTAKSAPAARQFSDYKASEGLRILYSTAPGKVSYEDDELQHSVFSYYLIRGLRGDAAGADGLITFDDLQSYATTQMRKYGVRTQRMQLPFQSGESSGDFLLARSVAPEVQAASGEQPMPASAEAPTQQLKGPESTDGDPSSRVARLNFVDGQVSLQPAGEQDWGEASLNRPIATGDTLWVDSIGHAELQLDNAVIRLAPQTGASIIQLNDQVAQLRLSQGTLNVRVRRVEANETIEIDTPQVAVSLIQPGDYRIQVSEDGMNTVVLVREGAAEASNGPLNFRMNYKQGARITGTGSVTHQMISLPGADAFDRWTALRDRRESKAAASKSARYVSPYMVGYEDLDDHGTWQPVRGHGMAWFPSVSTGWAPYRDGHWVYIAPWGWTWVDDSPWGFAPFHYGRWSMMGGRWGWFPGGAGIRPAYAPALVAWTVGVGVGWFPLGPREVYYPGYRTSHVYRNRVNVTNVNVTNINVTNVNVTNVNYVNRSNTTIVTRDAFVNARPVRQSIVRPAPSDLVQARVAHLANVQPERRSVVGQPASAGSRRGQPAAAAWSRPVVTRSATPRTVRQPELPQPAQIATARTTTAKPNSKEEARRLQQQQKQEQEMQKRLRKEQETQARRQRDLDKVKQRSEQDVRKREAAQLQQQERQRKREKEQQARVQNANSSRSRGDEPMRPRTTRTAQPSNQPANQPFPTTRPTPTVRRTEPRTTTTPSSTSQESRRTRTVQQPPAGQTPPARTVPQRTTTTTRPATEDTPTRTRTPKKTDPPKQ